MNKDIKNWAIVKITEDKEAFLKNVIADTTQQLTSEKNGNLSEELAKALYLEQLRLTENPWKVDSPNEKPYWQKIKKLLIKLSAEKTNSAKKKKHEEEIAKNIISRYAHEIIGHFSIPTYKFAKIAAPFLFSRLLNTASSKNFSRFFGGKYQLKDRIHIKGNIDLIRTLEKQGTLILVPTHFSNLDSFLVGYALSEIGLPPFAYGAGLNLYNNRLVGFFINRLGAYKVDRRKKNTFYLETLKSYSRETLKRGCHTLFFPGGTRSRSGGLESKIKLGLLGTAFDAQLDYFKKSKENNTKPKKIFVLPLVICYHFVLEGDSLIKQHLTQTGKEKYYIEKDQFSSWYKILKFVWNFFSKGTRITLSFGQPMDIFGNTVNLEGESLDKSGKKVDIEKYFYSKGELCSIPQRDNEYTKLLGKEIIKAYYKENTVLSSHLIAYVAFEMLLKRFSKLDLYDVLRLPEDDISLSYPEFESSVQKVLNRIYLLEKEDKIKVANHCKKDTDAIIRHGLRNLGVYHPKRVLYKTENNTVMSDDLNLLYFYHNRMEGYGLKKYI